MIEEEEMVSEMNGQERVLTVIQRKEPDRIPTFEWVYHSSIISAITNGGGYDDFIRTCDIDAVICGAAYPVQPISKGLILDEWGVTRTSGHEAYSMPVDEKAPIQSWADLENWSPPDPYAPHRIQSLKEQIDKFKGARAIIVRSRDVWSNPRDLMGYENLLIQCALNPDMVEQVVIKCIDHSIAMLDVAADLGGEIIMTGDDIADNNRSLISLTMLENIFMPHFRRFVDAIHDHNLYFWKHTDGNIREIMPILVDAGIDGIDPIDPTAGMDLGEVKHEWGDRVAIKGNVNCAVELVSGTKQDVEEAVKKCIREAGMAGGYACSSSNMIHSGVKPKLYKKMLDAIREYGVYPLDFDKLTPSG
jgi:uroporphyrinogen decarboxylase